MPLELSDIVITHGKPVHSGKRKIFRRANCSAGFYLAPTAGQTVSSENKLTITWDTSCISPAPSQVDIFMTAPYNTNPAVYTWYKVDYAHGTYDFELQPKWWNSTASVALQLNIVEHDAPPFLTSLPPGPVFQATYNASTAGTATQPSGAADTSVPFTPYASVNNSYSPGGLSKGGLAAAVLFPLIAVILAVGVYVKWSRAKETQKRQRRNQDVDRRMSTISGDWKSLSGAGANAAIRHSMAPSSRNTRTSSFFAGNGPYLGRPSSTFANEGGPNQHEDGDMVQIARPRASTLASAHARVSRVSFATDLPRPSMGGDSTRQSIYTTAGSRASRAYHRSGDEESPPPLPRNSLYPDDSPTSPSYNLSPTQTTGPQSLTPDVIRARLASGEVNDRPSMDGEFRNEVMQMPAMSMMLTGGNASDDYLIPATPITPPAPAATTDHYPEPSYTGPSVPPLSIDTKHSGMMSLSDGSTMLSPDAMLRAYAAKRTASKSGPSSGNTTMRTLYTPSTASDDIPLANSTGVGPRNPNRLTVDVGTNNPYRASMAKSGAFSEVSRYSVAPGGDVGKAE